MISATAPAEEGAIDPRAVAGLWLRHLVSLAGSAQATPTYSQLPEISGLQFPLIGKDRGAA